MVDLETSRLKIALIQMTSGHDLDVNLDFLLAHITEAAKGGARYVLTPENCLLMDLDGARMARTVSSLAYKDAINSLFNLAGELGIWLHLGSVAWPSKQDNPPPGKRPRMANRSYLISPDFSASQNDANLYFYDKIHMFDVTLPNGECYNESANYQAGENAVVVDCEWAKLGMTICYDLRFPALFRHLAQAGAEMISVPAAFTQTTGKAHWHLLLRARAIETGCFIVASAQTGAHENGRKTFGHSLIVAPWGDILLDAGDDLKNKPGVFMQTLDFELVRMARQTLPSLQHDMPFS